MDQPSPLMLVADGGLLRDNMRRAHVVEDEIRCVLRRHGASGLRDVRRVVLERNGVLTVVPRAPGLDPWLLADVTAPAVRGG